MSALRHDTFDGYYRTPFGAVPEGTSVRLRFRTAVNDVQSVTVFYYQFDPSIASNTANSPISFPMTFLENRDESGATYSFWEYTLVTPSTPAVLYYKFKISDGGTTAYYSDAYADDNDNLNQGGDGAPSTFEPFPAFQITVYDPNFQTPDWLQNANVYQIFPDRFRNGDKANDYGVPGSSSGSPIFYGNQPVIAHTNWNEAIYDPRQPGPYSGAYGNQFFGGDLKGIQNKLDYLQSLGFDTVYLTPIFQARSNHRYDTDNYLTVDPALGDDAAFASLVAAMDQRGMHLILDGVFNHASSDSLYFDRYHRYGQPDGACESLNSPFRSWFIFNSNNVPCGGNDYSGWFGFDSLPRFNKSDSGYRDFVYRNPTDNVIKHWYDRGASGWRFDVADDSDLRKIWHELRPYAKSYKADGPLIGEIWPDASQYLAGDQMDSVMNYRFRKNLLGFARGGVGWVDNDYNGNNTLVSLVPSQFDHALRAVREDYPPQATAAMLNLIDSHDTNRALFVLTEQGDAGLTQARERLRLAALFQFTYPGAPMVYYGDEAAINAPGQPDNNGVLQDDPYNRAPYPWSDETGDESVYGPADANMIAYYAALANLRKQHPALRTGAFETLLTGDTTPANSDDNTYAFARVSGAEKAIVALNDGNVANTVDLPVAAYFTDGTQLKDQLNNATYTVNSGKVTVMLPPRSGVILFSATATASAVQFAVPQFDVIEYDSVVTITVTRVGDRSTPASVDYATSDGPALQRTDYIVASGTLNFAPTETSKTFTVLIIDDGYQEGTETFNLALSNPVGTSLGVRNTARVKIFDDDLGPAVTNPIDDAHRFVREHYYDFLSRLPDQEGLDYWTSQITSCGSDQLCIRSRRIAVSDAFFFEPEFQETAAYVYRIYKAAFGTLPGAPNRANLTYSQFMPDRSRVIGGPQLDQGKTDVADAFVQRAAFIAQYPNTMTATQYINALNANTGNALTQSQQDALVTGLTDGTETRGSVLRKIADNQMFVDREYNASFVLAEYFGYLRRDPEPEGYDFWLGQVNRFPIRNIDIQHAMVCSFITSIEYQQRFSPIVTRTNAECPQ